MTNILIPTTRSTVKAIFMKFVCRCTAVCEILLSSYYLFFFVLNALKKLCIKKKGYEKLDFKMLVMLQ